MKIPQKLCFQNGITHIINLIQLQHSSLHHVSLYPIRSIQHTRQQKDNLHVIGIVLHQAVQQY